MNIESNNEQRSDLKFLTYGSPIMDLIVDVDDEFIKSNKLKLDTTSHASEDHKIFKEIENFNPIKVAGGCSYNAIRVLNWLLRGTKYEGKSGCVGSIGDDIYGETYSKLLEEENISHLFEKFKGQRTGVCATICEGRERCHMTDLGASTKISEEFVNSKWEEMRDLKLMYTEMYILSHREKTLYDFAKLCLDDNKLFGFNFPSCGFLSAFGDKILDMISYGDVLFANKEEAKFFVSNVLREQFTDMTDLSKILAKLPKKNKEKRRIFVITCGPEPVHIAIYNHKTNTMEFTGSFKPWSVPVEEIIDVNGAGDAFAGGFLAYYVQGYKIETCVYAGHWAAKEIIKVRGCDIPKNKTAPSEVQLLLGGGKNGSLQNLNEIYNSEQINENKEDAILNKELVTGK